MAGEFVRYPSAFVAFYPSINQNILKRGDHGADERGRWTLAFENFDAAFRAHLIVEPQNSDTQHISIPASELPAVHARLVEEFERLFVRTLKEEKRCFRHVAKCIGKITHRHVSKLSAVNDTGACPSGSL